MRKRTFLKKYAIFFFEFKKLYLSFLKKTRKSVNMRNINFFDKFKKFYYYFYAIEEDKRRLYYDRKRNTTNQVS